MQTKHLFLLPALAFLACAGLRAQVTIGGIENPKAGAILDLNSTAKGGLILSNVTITNPERIPHNATVFQGITDDDVNPNLRGAMVYNDGQNPAVPAGVYIWNGSCWTKNGGEVIINPPAITVDGAVKSTAVATQGSSTAVALTVASPQPDVKYEWYKNTTASTTNGISTGTTGETYSTPDNLTAGTYYYYCMATSLACPSVNAVFSEVITSTVLDPVVFQSGDGKLDGLRCFDVAAINDGDGCGTLASRTSNRRVFSTSPTENYTFTVDGSANPLSFDFKNLDAAHPVIQSISQSTSPDNKTVTVTFNAGLDTWARGKTRAQALQAELYAVYNTNQAAKLTLSVSDCQCCPGLLVVGGEYNDIAATTSLPTGATTNGQTNGGAAKALLDYYTGSKTGKDLCYYYRDANSSSATSGFSYYSWHDAFGSSSGSYSPRGICGTTQGVDAVDAHGDWRLPHLAELAQIGQVVSSYPAGINSGVGSQTHVNAAINQNTMGSDVIALPAGSNTSDGTYNLQDTYWSSTQYNGTDAWAWVFHSNSRAAGNGQKGGTLKMRCVRPF